MNTEWKTLKENSNYEININTCDIRNSKSKKVLKPHVDNKGYYYVSLYSNGKQKNYLLHRLIYNNLIEDLKSTDIIDHINCNKLDNSLENLRIVTRSENNINRKRKTDFIEIDEKTQETLVVLDLENEVFFYKQLNLFVRRIYLNKFRILPINYQSQYSQYIRYTTNGKNYQINITKYLFPKLAENVKFILVHSDGIYFDEANRKIYHYHSKSGLFKELKQHYQSKKCIQIHYRFNGKKKNMNIYGYLHKNDEVQQS